MFKRITPYPLRMSADLRKWVQEMADKNERSLNSEIKFVLKEYKKQKENRQEGNAVSAAS